jgi:hypothetical protein
MLRRVGVGVKEVILHKVTVSKVPVRIFLQKSTTYQFFQKKSDRNLGTVNSWLCRKVTTHHVLALAVVCAPRRFPSPQTRPSYSATYARTQAAFPHQLNSITMGWFWNSSPGSDASSKPADAFSHLSPEVRDFLEREAPIKPSHHSTSSPPPAPPSSPPAFDPTKYSKYGSKYADIWAQYKPLSVVENEARTPSMAISDVYESYRVRKAAVGKAAMENCVFENAALVECWGGGGGSAKLLRGCGAEHKKLDRCFMNQQVRWHLWGWEEESGGD